jgi:hypothetical protein
MSLETIIAYSEANTYERLVMQAFEDLDLTLNIKDNEEPC